MYILGITGNIGSGKSTVSERLIQRGAYVSHSDNLAKDLLKRDTVLLQTLSQRFGGDILDDSGKLRRSILAKRAFATREGQQFLNQLIHPEVRKATEARIEIAKHQETRLFVIDAPLLFEAGIEDLCESVLVVTADKNFRLKRLEQRCQISRADFERRDHLQLPIEEKLSRADHIIHNNGSIAELFEQVDRLYEQLTL